MHCKSFHLVMTSREEYQFTFLILDSSIFSSIYCICCFLSGEDTKRRTDKYMIHADTLVILKMQNKTARPFFWAKRKSRDEVDSLTFCLLNEIQKTIQIQNRGRKISISVCLTTKAVFYVYSYQIFPAPEWAPRGYWFCKHSITIHLVFTFFNFIGKKKKCS